MVRFLKILLVVFLTAFAVPAFSEVAATVSAVAEELADHGYEVSRISKTFWGRVKIVARKDDLEREVILNPNTGEILRDLVRRLRLKQGSDNAGSGNQSTTSGSGSDDDTSDDGGSDSDDSDEADESDESDESDSSDSSDSPDSPDEPDDD